MKIKKLSNALINKIAAGEVVERPASVIKELVENAIDAGAKTIEIDVRNAGKDYICVKDDGCGMDREDATMSVEQHATSKINDINDLFCIKSFGFRGEALASISSVSDFLLHTKAQGMEGTEVYISDNKKTLNTINCHRGTKVVVKNLFKNIPARRAYLKSNVTEFGHIVETVTKFALSHKDIRFKLTHNSKLIFNLPLAEDLKERINSLLGKSVSDNLMKCSCAQGVYTANGFIGKPSIAQPNRNIQHLFVNARSISSPIISKAVQEAFESLIPHGRYPVFVLDVGIDPKVVDVNVHPRKSEIRFKDSQGVFRFVLHAVRVCIRENDIFKKIDIGSKYAQNIGESSIKRPIKAQNGFNLGESSVYKKPVFAYQKQGARANLDFSKYLLQETPQPAEPDLGSWALLGQIKDSYLVVEDANRGLLLIDQHAAAERINYEKISRDYNENEKISTQKLLMPINMDLPLNDFNKILAYKKDLRKIGFDIEEFGQNTIIINAVPSLIKNKNIKKIIMELVGDNDLGISKSQTVDYLLKTISCKAAIKFGDKLPREAQVKLLQELKLINNRMSCAHGRPIILELSWGEIRRKFERT